MSIERDVLTATRLPASARTQLSLSSCCLFEHQRSKGERRASEASEAPPLPAGGRAVLRRSREHEDGDGCPGDGRAHQDEQEATEEAFLGQLLGKRFHHSWASRSSRPYSSWMCFDASSSMAFTVCFEATELSSS